MIFPDRKYGVILIDPPWAFKTYGGSMVVPTQGEQPYTTMPLYQIAGLPIPDLLEKNGAVVLWDNDSIPHTLPLLAEVWGLRVATKNLFIWDKGERIGMGYYTRKQGEVAHLLVRGKPKRKSASVRQIIREERRQHSRKPDGIHSRVMELFDGPYLEIFGRRHVEGWDVVGNEADKFDASEGLRLGEIRLEDFDL